MPPHTTSPFNMGDDNLHSHQFAQSDIIAPGKYVIVRKAFENNSFKLIKISNDRFIFFGKQKIAIDSILGQRFGSTFELNNEKRLVQINLRDYILTADPADSNHQKDNRFIKDDNKSQKLTRNEIEKIKKENSGKDIIQSLIENSSTFVEKNVFSQEKYLIKKKQKYLNLYTILKPNLKSLMETYYSQGPAKNNYLRIDSLAQMLTLANIMAGGKYIVVDSNLGILSAAIMEKTAGQCSIIQVYPGSPVGSNRQAVHALNFPESTVQNCLYTIGLTQVAKLLVDNKADSKPLNHKVRTKNQVLRQAEEHTAKEILQGREIDSLLLLNKNYDPMSLFNILFEFLSISRPFVIFSSSIEPLKECYVQLKNKCIYLKISETWLRKYQVLPNRTHPEMSMNASSGFILSGIKVET